MKTMKVEVVSNEQHIFSGEAGFVVVPTVNGELGIYPQHIPIMSLVRPGVLRLKTPDSQDEVLVAVSGGLLEVQPDKLTILAEVAVRSSEIDQARADEAKRLVEEREKIGGHDKLKTHQEAALAAAIAELKTLEYIRQRRK